MFEETTIVGTTYNPGKAYIYKCPCVNELPPVALCQDIAMQLDETKTLNILIEDVDVGSYDDFY